MKRLILLLTAILLTYSLSAVNIEIRQTKDFNKIKLSHSIDLKLIQGERNSLKVYTNKDLNEVVTEVVDDVLIIRMKEKKAYKNLETTVKVTFKELEEITAISSSKIVADERIEASDLSIISKNRSKVNMNVDANNVDINASGESNLKLELNCEMVFIEINTNSEINLSGSIKKAHLKAGSSAIISAKNLEIDEADIKATGKANVSVNVTGNIKLYSSSGAIIKYSGKSEVVSEKTESGGKIKQF